jgi:NlpC/P60 family putative phage cell wall peptidase
MDRRRRQVLNEARSWIGTPYHHGQCLKGIGVDCVWIMIAVYRTIGVVPRNYSPGSYTRDWYMHRHEELYLEGVKQYARPLPIGVPPLPGDVALYKIGRCVSHGAIIVDDEHVIHAYRKDKKVTMGLRREPNLANYFHSYWSPFR